MIDFEEITVKAKLKVKCKNCGDWNVIDVEKIFFNTGNLDSGLKVFLPAYRPLKTEKCSKCNQVIAKEKEIIGKRRAKSQTTYTSSSNAGLWTRKSNSW